MTRRIPPKRVAVARQAVSLSTMRSSGFPATLLTTRLRQHVHGDPCAFPTIRACVLGKKCDTFGLHQVSQQFRATPGVGPTETKGPRVSFLEGVRGQDPQKSQAAAAVARGILPAVHTSRQVHVMGQGIRGIAVALIAA